MLQREVVDTFRQHLQERKRDNERKRERETTSEREKESVGSGGSKRVMRRLVKLSVQAEEHVEREPERDLCCVG